ncbi:hypothetical protein VDGE_30170 [Verticillium dahliae]|uniref:Uncharacterized protein n=1 Tax=Verticillium dahliae TaxID=27337 RepID=A0A444RRN4_VERDA|nr:hypothetical protein VDGE_30170 [Verticillium dahliae]
MLEEPIHAGPLDRNIILEGINKDTLEESPTRQRTLSLTQDYPDDDSLEKTHRWDSASTIVRNYTRSCERSRTARSARRLHC